MGLRCEGYPGGKGVPYLPFVELQKPSGNQQNAARSAKRCLNAVETFQSFQRGPSVLVASERSLHRGTGDERPVAV